jgi:hypothetical protein
MIIELNCAMFHELHAKFTAAGAYEWQRGRNFAVTMQHRFSGGVSGALMVSSFNAASGDEIFTKVVKQGGIP